MYARNVAVASLEDRYRAATEAVALLDRSERGKLALSGSQAVEFLDSLLSNDIAAVEPGHGVAAALLTHKGRLLAEVRVLRSEVELELDCERAALQALFDALNSYRIGFDAELHKRTLERALLSLIGPGSDALFEHLPGPAEHDHIEAEINGRAVLLIRTDLGLDLLCASEDGEAVAAALAAAGAQTVDEETAEIVRVETGRPRFGIEIDETTMPQEAGIHERAVSYSKGCYVGQETVARLYWKGKPNRHLRGLRFAQSPQPGAALTLGGHEVGAVASVAHSPRFGTIGLALLRREAEPGATLEVSGGGSATVSGLPFER